MHVTPRAPSGEKNTCHNQTVQGMIQFALFIRILRTLLLIQIPALYYPQQNKARRTKARFYTETISCSNSTTDVRRSGYLSKESEHPTENSEGNC
ncbi:unnamed protein product [Pocillopora meandrina]|uniref:Uncharacterized protein n=1 Tax=Pocillopora meandrina TaxID=46732 RepID=A0AAU9W7C9_9CNID|nr:unnamed protein product [Pocillopora meandrina]